MPDTHLSTGPSLFRQIAVRLALVTLLFALLDVAIVVATYLSEPESLAQELLTLEAEAIAQHPGLPANTRSALPDASHWSIRTIDPATSQFPVPPDRPQLMRSSMLLDWTMRERVGDGYRITGVRMIAQDDGPKWLLMVFEGRGVRPFWPVIRNELLEHVAVPLVPLALLMLVFNVVSVRRVLGPLRRAESEVDSLDPENMALRLSEPDAPREVSTLVRAVNRALGRLDVSMGILRTFTANAAHELRTPLSVLQLSLDRLPAGAARDDLQADTAHMTRLVSQMLDLAQADALVLDAQRVDLAAIGRNVVGLLAPKAFEARREIRFEDRGNALAMGHAEAIFRIYRNLVENALVHAAGIGAIEVVAGPGPQISVRDHGDGIAEADRALMFERFWRKDRSTTTGAGLGLGIVKRLVEAHGGTITVNNADGGGALFRVCFQPVTAMAPTN
jgi:signal transduction histidine kinase